MSDSAYVAITKVVEQLRMCNREHLGPDEAQKYVAAIQESTQGIEVDLVWTDEPFDGSLHYDALIRTSDRDTISISVCPETTLPWPLRGVQRWRDSHLVRVNDTVLEVVGAIAQLEIYLEDALLMQKLVDGCLVTEALKKYPVEVNQLDIQDALNAIRRQRGLLTSADTHAWMEDTGMSYAALEKMALSQARAVKLREVLVGDKVDEYLAENSADFDRLRLARVYIRTESLANECMHRIRQGESDILQIAQHVFLNEPAGINKEIFWASWRFQLPQELREAVEQAEANQVLGPVPVSGGFWIVQVLSVQPAERDSDMRLIATAALFQKWLANQRSKARIEWYLGKAKNVMAPFVKDASAAGEQTIDIHPMKFKG